MFNPQIISNTTRSKWFGSLDLRPFVPLCPLQWIEMKNANSKQTTKLNEYFLDLVLVLFFGKVLMYFWY